MVSISSALSAILSSNSIESGRPCARFLPPAATASPSRLSSAERSAFSAGSHRESPFGAYTTSPAPAPPERNAITHRSAASVAAPSSAIAATRSLKDASRGGGGATTVSRFRCLRVFPKNFPCHQDDRGNRLLKSARAERTHVRLHGEHFMCGGTTTSPHRQVIQLTEAGSRSRRKDGRC